MPSLQVRAKYYVLIARYEGIPFKTFKTSPRLKNHNTARLNRHQTIIQNSKMLTALDFLGLLRMI